MHALLRVGLCGVFFYTATQGFTQLVEDGATNIISGTTSSVSGNLTVGTNGSFTALILTNAGEVDVTNNAFIGRETGSFSNSH